MKSVLYIDKDEKLFLPSLLYVDEFEKLLRKKNKVLIQAVLFHFIKGVLVDKRLDPKKFELDFTEIDNKCLKSIKNNEKIEASILTKEEKGYSYKNRKVDKKDIDDLIKKYLNLKGSSRVINFGDIFRNIQSRGVFLYFFNTSVDKATRSELSKQIEKHLMSESHFYLELYEQHVQNSTWFKNHNKKNILITWLLENIANVALVKEESLAKLNSKNLINLLEKYFSLQQINFPIFNFEAEEKRRKQRDYYALLTPEDKKDEIEVFQNEYQTKIRTKSLKTIQLYLLLQGDKNNPQLIPEISDFFKNIVRSLLSEEIDFEDTIQFFFEIPGVEKFLELDSNLSNIDCLIYLNNFVTNSNFLINFYIQINNSGKGDIRKLIEIPGRGSKDLSAIIVKDYWKNMIEFASKNFSENSQKKNTLYLEIFREISLDVLNNELFSDSSADIESKLDFYKFSKKMLGKKESTELSYMILENLNLSSIKDTTLKYFETQEVEALKKFLTDCSITQINQLAKKGSLLSNLFDIENKNLIPIVLGVFQSRKIKIFSEYPQIVKSKYFWTAFSYNLNDNQAIAKNLELTNSLFFHNFLLTQEGVNWLKSDAGTYWLELPESDRWQQSPEGIFIQKIVLENQNFYINDEEVFNSYVLILDSIIPDRIDDLYLMNNAPEALEYLLNKNINLILLIDFEHFDRFLELGQIILKNKELFLENNNQNIVLKSFLALMHAEALPITHKTTIVIEDNLEYIYENNRTWFFTDNFSKFLHSSGSDIIYNFLLKKTYEGFSLESKKIVELLVKTSGAKYLNLLMESNSYPYWIMRERYFIESFSKSQQISRQFLNKIGYTFFNNSLRVTGSQHKDWFTEFINIFAILNHRKLKPRLIQQINKDCNSTKCKSRKSSKNKEGFEDFYGVVQSIAYYFIIFNTVTRPYKCDYSELWHKTTDWE